MATPPAAEVGLAIGFQHASGDRSQGTPCPGTPPWLQPPLRSQHDGKWRRAIPVHPARVLPARTTVSRPRDALRAAGPATDERLTARDGQSELWHDAEDEHQAHKDQPEPDHKTES